MRILIVEDEYYLAADLAQALTALGAQIVGPVATVADAQLMLDRQHIEGAVVDVNLRGEMSFPIADRLEAAGIRYVITTGYDAAAIPHRFRTVPRLEKPYRADAVAALLDLASEAAG